MVSITRITAPTPMVGAPESGTLQDRWRRGRCVGLALALAVGGQALFVSAAGASWSPPVNLSGLETVERRGPDQDDVAVDHDGDAIVVWSDLLRVRARRISSTGVVSPTQTLSADDRYPDWPAVAMDQDGDAVVAWRAFRADDGDTRVQARRISKSGVISPILTLSAHLLSGDPVVRVAVDQDGDAVVVWTRNNGVNDRVQARRISINGTVGPILTLSSVGHDAYSAKVAVDRDGDALVAWTRDGGRVQARRISKSGAVGPTQTVSVIGQYTLRPDVAVDQDGNAVVIWPQDDDNNRCLQARRIPRIGALGPIKTLSCWSAWPDHYLDPPQVAVDQDGDAVVVWIERNGVPADRVQARRISKSGAVGDYVTLSAGSVSNPKVAVDSDGDAVVIWSRYDGANRRVQARRFPRSGITGSIKTLSAAGSDVWWYGGNVAIDRAGDDAVVVWFLLDPEQPFDYPYGRVQAALGP